MKAYYLETR